MERGKDINARVILLAKARGMTGDYAVACAFHDWHALLDGLKMLRLGVKEDFDQHAGLEWSCTEATAQVIGVHVAYSITSLL